MWHWRVTLRINHCTLQNTNMYVSRWGTQEWLGGGGVSLYDVTSCLVTWSHVPSGGLWLHLTSGGSLSGGFSVRDTLPQDRDPACILMECFLVLCMRHTYRLSMLRTFRRDALSPGLRSMHSGSFPFYRPQTVVFVCPGGGGLRGEGRGSCVTGGMCGKGAGCA